MQINDLTELKKLIRLCRKEGVTEFVLGDFSCKLGELPEESGQVTQTEESTSDNPYANFPDAVLTPEQLAFYSAGGMPENDPENKETN